MLEWIKNNWLPVIIQIACVFLTYFLTVRHERNKDNHDALNSELSALKKENTALNEKLHYYEDVEQSPSGNYLILKATQQPICPVCWGKEHKAIPVYGTNTGYFTCGCCAQVGVFDRQTVKRIAADEERAEQELINTMNARSSDLRKYF